VADRPLTFTSPTVQRLRRLAGRRSARLDEGVVVVEGALLVREAAAAGWSVEAQFLAPDAEPAVDAPAHVLAAGVVERVATTEHPQPVIAVVRRRTWTLDGLTALAAASPAAPVVVMAGVADPGNAGTIIRSAEAAGAVGVVTTMGSVDVTNPKVVRASAGALFHVPVVDGVAGERLGSLGRRLLGAVAAGEVSYTACDLCDAVALVMGNEAHGIPADVALDGTIRIEHAGRAESLNVAMAATVLCFEALRQRTSGRGGPQPLG
jgi:TrmH family RNA methyltransferase